MTLSPNLTRRAGAFYFRRLVPRSARGVVGKGEIVRSLRTADVRLAAMRSRQPYILTEELFGEVRNAAMLTAERLAQIVEHYRDLLLELENSFRLTNGPMSEDVRVHVRYLNAQDQEELRADLARGDLSRSEPLVSHILQTSGLQLDEFERRQLGQALLLSAVEALPTIDARLAGNFSQGLLVHRGRRETTAQRSEHSRPAPGRTVKVLGLERASIGRGGDVFSHTAKRFLADQRKGRIWDEQTAKQAEKSFKIFVEVVGDRGLKSYARSDAASFKGVLQDLPADYGKAAIFRGLTVTDIAEVDAKRQTRVERLSTRTVKRHFSALSALWKWAASQEDGVVNPFRGFSFPSLLRANEQREMWESEELVALFKSPLWAGCLSQTRRSTPGSIVIRDEKFWLPLVAVLSGLRQEEICQL